MNLVEPSIPKNFASTELHGDGKKPKKVGAQLTLESFLLYKHNTTKHTYEIFPEPRAIKNQDGRTSVVLGNIPFPEGVPYPKNALTALYGFRDALEEFQLYLRFAREKDMKNIKVTFKVQVNEIVMGTTDIEKLQTTGFLNLRRLQSDLAKIIVDGVNERMSSEVQNGKVLQPFNKTTEACQRPDLLCDVIRSEKVFSHIKAVSYMIPDSTNSRRGRQVCTIFTDQFEDVGFRGDMPFDVEMPKFLPSAT